MAKIIQLTQGQVALVCDCHAHLVENHKWCARWSEDTKSFYAVRGTSRAERLAGAPSIIQMHRVINATPGGFETDHIDGETLNNQCSNLRNATHMENQHNKKIRQDNTTGFRGVAWHKNGDKFRAQIRVNGKSKHLGLFIDAIDAARAYDTAARELHGEFAWTNFEN